MGNLSFEAGRGGRREFLAGWLDLSREPFKSQLGQKSPDTSGGTGAFSSEVDAGSRQENASN
jgi:hypothetical protein